jgi:hypothetical protein
MIVEVKATSFQGVVIPISVRVPSRLRAPKSTVKVAMPVNWTSVHPHGSPLLVLAGANIDPFVEPLKVAEPVVGIAPSGVS